MSRQMCPEKGNFLEVFQGFNMREAGGCEGVVRSGTIGERLRQVKIAKAGDNQAEGEPPPGRMTLGPYGFFLSKSDTTLPPFLETAPLPTELSGLLGGSGETTFSSMMGVSPMVKGAPFTWLSSRIQV